MVLVGADEHDRALRRRDPGAQVPAIIEIGRDPQLEHVDEAVDGTGRAGSTEHDGMARGIATHALEDQAAGLLAEAGRLEARAGGLRVGVRVQRQDGVPDVVLDEREGPPGRRVVRVGHASHPVRSGHGLVIADDGCTHQVDERVRPRTGSRGAAIDGGGGHGRVHVPSSLWDASR